MEAIKNGLSATNFEYLHKHYTAYIARDMVVCSITPTAAALMG